MTTQVEKPDSQDDVENKNESDEKGVDNVEPEIKVESSDENNVIDYDGGSESEGENESKYGLAGMSDVISKILNKNINNKQSSIVLSKSKSERKRKKEQIEESKSKKAKDEELLKQKEINHVLPIEVNDAVKEAMLKRIGTKGVVMLFNAVSAHQKAKAEKMKKAKTEGEKVKVEKSMKKSTFMDMLKSDKSKQGKDIKVEDEEEKEESTWNVLKSDFMLGSSMKHWDKDEDDDGKSTKKKVKNVKESLEIDTSEDEADDD